MKWQCDLRKIYTIGTPIRLFPMYIEAAKTQPDTADKQCVLLQQPRIFKIDSK